MNNGTENNRKITIAFGSVPKDGGTYTFYRNIRPKLLEKNIDLRCVSVGKKEVGLIENTYIDKGCVILAENTLNVKTQAQIFSDWCEAVGIDIVIGINSIAILSALPHLPQNIRVMARCANSFDHGYRITIACYDRLAAIIAQTPRQFDDLQKEYGVSTKKLTLIPNGIEIEPFKNASLEPRGQKAVLEIGYIGRLEHHQKGVLFLPEIVRRLKKKSVPFVLKIAGKGVHGKTLENKLGQYAKAGEVQFLGALPPTQISKFLSEIDVIVFPSQFEGCPNALLEAMIAGCVPVSSHLEGITDFIIKEENTGFLCPVGDCESFANYIAELSGDREKIREISKGAAKDARGRFSSSRAADDYSIIFNKVMGMAPPKWNPKPWSEFRVEPAFKESWVRHIPNPVKMGIKNLLFHVGLSNRLES